MHKHGKQVPGIKQVNSEQWYPAVPFFWLLPNYDATAKLRRKAVHLKGNTDILLWALLKLLKLPCHPLFFTHKQL